VKWYSCHKLAWLAGEEKKYTIGALISWLICWQLSLNLVPRDTKPNLARLLCEEENIGKWISMDSNCYQLRPDKLFLVALIYTIPME